MIQQSELTAQDSRETMQSVSHAHLPLEANGYVCTSEMLYDVLMKAASENISIDAACRDLEQSASGNRIRELLNEQLSIEQLQQYEQQINEALASRLPHQLQSRSVEAAIDEHDEPFYGKTPELRAYACRSKPKAGTGRFFRIISLYVIYRQMRVTLAVAFVRPEEQTVAIVQRLLRCAECLKIQIDVLYMDRGFRSGAVIGYLQKVKQHAILACTIRGKAGGTRQLCRGRKSYRTRTHSPTTPSSRWRSWPHLFPTRKRNGGANGCFSCSSASTGNPRRSIDAIVSRFRHRSFLSHLAASAGQDDLIAIRRCASSSFGFALLLVNIWAFLRWFVARIPGRGPHRLDPTLFQFQAFVSMLRRSIEHLYGAVMAIPMPAGS